MSGAGRMRRIEEELKLLTVEQRPRTLLQHGPDGTVRIDTRAVQERVREERDDAWFFRHTDTRARVAHQSQRVAVFHVPHVERFQLQYAADHEAEDAARSSAVPQLLSHFIRSSDEKVARRRALFEAASGP